MSHEKGQVGLLPKKQKQNGCKQVYDKVNYCTYCMKAISSKISRHLLCVHKEEPKVRDILTLPKKSKARTVKQELLFNEENFKHNLEVLKKKEGFLVVGRRDANSETTRKEAIYRATSAKRFIMKQTLWVHERNCSIS